MKDKIKLELIPSERIETGQALDFVLADKKQDNTKHSKKVIPPVNVSVSDLLQNEFLLVEGWEREVLIGDEVISYVMKGNHDILSYGERALRKAYIDLMVDEVENGNITKEQMMDLLSVLLQETTWKIRLRITFYKFIRKLFRFDREARCE